MQTGKRPSVYCLCMYSGYEFTVMRITVKIKQMLIITDQIIAIATALPKILSGSCCHDGNVQSYTAVLYGLHTAIWFQANTWERNCHICSEANSGFLRKQDTPVHLCFRDAKEGILLSELLGTGKETVGQ